MTINKKRAAIIGTVAAVAISGTGVAYAFFTAGGTGTGTASTGTAVDWTIDDLGKSGADLSPGGATQTATFKVTNGASFTQRLTKVTVSIKNADGSAWTPSGGCTAADFSLNSGTAGAAADVAVGADVATTASVTKTVTIKMVETGVAQDGCQGKTVPLYYAAS